jgi:hypothetical protein
VVQQDEPVGAAGEHLLEGGGRGEERVGDQGRADQGERDAERDNGAGGPRDDRVRPAAVGFEQAGAEQQPDDGVGRQLAQADRAEGEVAAMEEVADLEGEQGEAEGDGEGLEGGYQVIRAWRSAPLP